MISVLRMMVVARANVLLKPTMTVKAPAAMVLSVPVKPVKVRAA